MKKIFFIFTASILLVFYQNCSEFNSTSAGSLDGFSNFNYIQSNVLSTTCQTCHSGASPQGGIDLSSYSAIIASGTVIAGNAAGSTLYTELLSGDMPPGGPAVNNLTVDAIAAWINAGARENELPTVNAGNDINVIIPNTSTAIIATATDVDGTISSYSWTQISGPNTPSLSGASSSTLSITGLIIGSYSFLITVLDDFGDQSTDTVNVVVSDAPNTPPSVSAGADRNVDDAVGATTIIASASDSDGSIVTYAWVQSAGPTSATLSGENTASLMTSNMIIGTYTFTITVTDDDGATANDSINIIVAEPPPTLTELKTDIFNSKCNGCHIGGSLGGYNMDTYSNLMQKVNAGNAGSSLLFLEVNAETMPTNSNKLTAGEKIMVRDWINAGALDN